MAGKRSIGATLVLKAGEFFANARKAQQTSDGLKGKLQALTGQNSKLNSSNKLAASGFGSVAKKIAGVAAATVSVSAIKNFAQECVNAANVQEDAEERLATTMLNVKGTTMENVQEIKKYAAELQLATTIGDEATIQGASQLATFQLQSSTIKTLLPSLQDLAAAQYGTAVSGDQMQQMANLMGKVMSGNVSSLSRYGVIMDENQKKILQTGNEAQKAAMLVEVLNKNFGGIATSKATTMAGVIQSLKNAWGDMQEEIGFKLQPVVNKLVHFIGDNIPQIQSTLINTVTGIIDKVSGLYSVCKPSIDNLKNAFSGAGERIKSAFGNLDTGGLSNFIKNLLPTLINYAAKIVEFAGKIGAFIVTNLPRLISIIKSIVDALRNVVNTVWQAVQPTIQAIANAFKQAWELIKVVWNAVAPYFQIVWSNILSGLNVVKTFISGAFNTSWELIKLVWNAAAGYFTAVWNSIAAVFSVVRNVLTGNWQGAWDGIKGIVDTWSGYFNNIWESIKNVFSSVKTWFADTFSAAGDAIKNSIVRSVNGAISIANKIPGVNIPTIGNVPGLATGGVIQRSGTVWVGERGPELLTLPRGAQVTPLDKAGGGNTINIYVTGGGSADGTVNEIVTKLKLALANL